MPHREIRYVGSAWQVLDLPDGSKEFTFTDPDQVTIHVLPLPKLASEQIAAQLRGDHDHDPVKPPRRHRPPGPDPTEAD